MFNQTVDEATHFRTGRDAAEAVTSRHFKELIAASLGNTFEWFDFVIYGSFVLILAQLFLPPRDPNGALLWAYGAFAVGFVARPLGGLMFGLLGDRVGRKKVLVITIWLMVAGTLMIGIAPTYASAGWTGATMIVGGRLLQGLGASGEYGSALAFLVENAPPGRRNLYASLQMTSTMFAIVIAGVIGVLLLKGLSAEALESWGWRLPFLFGLLIGPIGYYIRKNIDETEAFESAEKLSALEVLRQLFGKHLRTTVAALCMTTTGTITFYLALFYMASFAVRELHLSPDAPFLSTAVAGLVIIVVCPLSAALADRVIRSKTLLTAGMILLALIAYPLFAWTIAEPSLGHLLTTLALIAIPLGIVSGLAGPAISQAFPVAVRATGLSLTYNLPTTVFGGFSPLIVTYLIQTFGDKAAPAYYIVAAAILGIIGTLLLPRQQ